MAEQALVQLPVSFVDPQGNAVGAPRPDLEDEEAKQLYADMRAIQLLDERFTILVRTGKTSIMTPAAGHEAAHVGIARAIDAERDWVFPYYRDQGLLLALGVPPVELFGQMLGTTADPGKGRQTPTHATCRAHRIFSMSSPVGSHLPAAVGAALAVRRREPGAVVVCTFGDGATSTGDFHGALTLAGVQRAPIVFICENNRYAISVPIDGQSASETIAAKAIAYGMPGGLVDGLDVLAVRHVVAAAAARARQGYGPSLIELDLYRFGAHSSSDDDSRYRDPAEIERRRPGDAVARYRRFLEARGLWTASWDAALATRVRSALADALRAAEEAGPAPASGMFDDVFAELPWHLRDQRAALSRELD